MVLLLFLLLECEEDMCGACWARGVLHFVQVFVPQGQGRARSAESFVGRRCFAQVGFAQYVCSL